MYRLFFKRFFDILLSFMALVILSPIYILMAILIKLKLGSPVIFKQKRPGKNCKVFTMYKFRTMTNKKDSEGNLLSDEERLTKFGKLLRALSIDELPEIWNIFKGDMSIIGPRPLLVQYLPLYSEEQNKRHKVRPGLTGYAQVNGRNAITWQKKFELDVYYVNKLSIFMDFSIFFKTIKKVLVRDGINQNDNTTMEFFKGNYENEQIQIENTHENSDKLNKEIVNIDPNQLNEISNEKAIQDECNDNDCILKQDNLDSINFEYSDITCEDVEIKTENEKIKN